MESRRMSQRRFRAYTTSFGKNVSHSKRRTNKMWKMNLQWARVPVNGKLRRVKISTRDLRTLYKQV